MDRSLCAPLSAECPCGPDLEYDPEFLLLFNRAAPREEVQYGDFVSAPENIDWPELECDARRLLARSKDIRILVILLRCRIQQAGAQGLAEALALLETLCTTYPDAIYPQLAAGHDASADEASIARSNALSSLLDHEGVMADIRSITLSHSAALRLQVRDVERALALPRPADSLAPESIYQQLTDLNARGMLPVEGFHQATHSLARLQQWADATLGEMAPDFTPLKRLLALLPDAVQSESSTPLSAPAAPAPAPDDILDGEPLPLAASREPIPEGATAIEPPANPVPQQIRNRNDAQARLRAIRLWFESSEPSSPTIPLLRQAERLVGKRFSEVISEIPPELLEKWDAQD